MHSATERQYTQTPRCNKVSLAYSHGQHRNTGYSSVYVHTQYVATQPRGETERGSGRCDRHPVCHNAKWSAHATMWRVDSCVYTVRSIAMKIASDVHSTGRRNHRQCVCSPLRQRAQPKRLAYCCLREHGHKCDEVHCVHRRRCLQSGGEAVLVAVPVLSGCHLNVLTAR